MEDQTTRVAKKQSSIAKNSSQTHFPLVATQNLHYLGAVSSPLLAPTTQSSYLLNTAEPMVSDHLHPSLTYYNRQPIKSKAFPMDLHLPNIPDIEAELGTGKGHEGGSS